VLKNCRLAIASCVCLLTLVVMASGQQDLSDQPRGSDLPGTVINDRAISLQTSLYPTQYPDSSAAIDMKWVAANDTDLVRFWHLNGDSVLYALAELSGIGWQDETITIYFVRYYPTLGSADPVIIPTGGIKVGPVTEAVPRGAMTNFNLIYQLAERLLQEGTASSNTSGLLASHPLMQPGPCFRDNLALLLAYSVSQRLFGSDSTSAAYNAPLFKRHTTGRALFDRGLHSDWMLTADKPLTLYLSLEKPDSRIMTMSYSLAANPVSQALPRRSSIEGLPPDGRLGFSIRLGGGNQLVVDEIDSTRVAFKGGLRKGDIIRSVGGQRVRTHRELIEAILDNLDSGVTLQVSRNDRTETVYLHSKSKG
jgi:hypothetical protein